MNRPTLSIAISSLSRQYPVAERMRRVAPMPASAPAAENGSAASSWTEAPAEESAADSTSSNAPAAESERRIRPTSPVAEGGRRSRGPPAYSAQYEPSLRARWTTTRTGPSTWPTGPAPPPRRASTLMCASGSSST
ncbi:MAG: hypothetical protein R3A10_05125 [Caldilineaceae bacterium]